MNNKLSEQFNDFAEDFSQKAAIQNKDSIVAFYNEFTFPLQGKTLIDLGCGDGADIKKFLAMGAIVSGVDASEKLLDLARKQIANTTLKLGLFEDTPFEDEQFDIAASKYAFQHSAQIEPIFREIYRILKPNGMLVFLVGHPMRQYIEKKKPQKNYFKKEIVHSLILDGTITVQEPTHTFMEYLSPYFLEHFELLSFVEGHDPAAEKIDDDTYPGFLVIKARKRKYI